MAEDWVYSLVHLTHRCYNINLEELLPNLLTTCIIKRSDKDINDITYRLEANPHTAVVFGFYYNVDPQRLCIPAGSQQQSVL